MSMRSKGFTLVEIMIVVLIIGILLSIAVPQWMKARARSQTNACYGNLKQIENAKEELAMEMHLPQGAPVVNGDLWPAYIKGSTFPACAAGGTYTLNTIGTPASCDIHGLVP